MPFTLVTGASTGLGLELARLSGSHGHDVVLTARSEERLNQLARSLRDEFGVRAEVVALDLSTPGSAGALFAEISRRGLEVDRLVNNAGFGGHGPFHEMSLELQLEMLRLNVLSLTELAHLFLPFMVSRGRGRILNVASTAGLQAGPFMAVYYASKAYVLSFSEALSEELRGSGVTVTALLPGPTRTEFQARAKMEGVNLTRFGLADARSVAEAGFRAMERGRAVVIPGTMNRALALLVRLTPRALVRRVVSRLNRGASGPSSSAP